MNQVRWGLLSTANINRRLIPAIRESERGVLAAVASRSQDSASSYAADWNIPLAFGSYDSMLESDEIDAVYIGLPNHLHVPWTLRALDEGKHVLCEKPFALSLDEMDKVIRKARHTGLVVAEAFMYRHHPQTKIVGEWVESGRLGEIKIVSGAFSFKLENPNNIRLVPEYGGGSLWDVGIYPLSLAQYVMGEAPVWVHGDQCLGESKVDMLFSGQMRYSGERMAMISSSFWAPFHTYFEIAGTEGRLEMLRPFVGIEYGDYMTYYPEKGDPVPILVIEKELYLGQVQDMHNAILNGWRNLISLEETRDHVRTVLALYESANTGRVVHLS